MTTRRFLRARDESGVLHTVAGCGGGRRQAPNLFLDGAAVSGCGSCGGACVGGGCVSGCGSVAGCGRVSGCGGGGPVLDASVGARGGHRCDGSYSPWGEGRYGYHADSAMEPAFVSEPSGSYSYDPSGATSFGGSGAGPSYDPSGAMAFGGSVGSAGSTALFFGAGLGGLALLLVGAQAAGFGLIAVALFGGALLEQS